MVFDLAGHGLGVFHRLGEVGDVARTGEMAAVVGENGAYRDDKVRLPDRRARRAGGQRTEVDGRVLTDIFAVGAAALKIAGTEAAWSAVDSIGSACWRPWA